MKEIIRTHRVHLKETHRTVSRVQDIRCKVGKLAGKEFRRGDLTIFWEKVPEARIFINSAVLKNALLNSKDFLRTELGLEVKDLARKEFFTPEIVKEEIVPVEEELVVQNPKPKFTKEEPEIVEPVFGFEEKSLETMTVKELREVAEKQNIEVPFIIKKAELLALIKGE
jgi:hypothetical protein